ncbi:MAG: peptidase, partial [Rhodobacteraceae bacterium]|nr:peptidase [Paracoccaceae bacterium]
NGLIFMSDTRTNAGVDNISQFCKLFTFEKKNERFITLLAAGNLATTQSVISLLEERNKAPTERGPSIMEAPSMFQVARLVGDTLREVIQRNSDVGQKADSTFHATFIVGGQIDGSEPRLFLIYPEQIGETKYGRPIMLRAYDAEMSWEAAIKLLLISFDSTVKANLSVGLPLDMLVYQKDSFASMYRDRITSEDPYFLSISNGWGEALKSAFDQLPDFKL